MSEPRYILAVSGGDILTCIRCDSEAPTVHREHLSPDGKLSGRLCKFCDETELGTIIAYERQAPLGQVQLARSIAQALNLVYWNGKRVPQENVDA